MLEEGRGSQSKFTVSGLSKIRKGVAVNHDGKRLGIVQSLAMA